MQQNDIIITPQDIRDAMSKMQSLSSNPAKASGPDLVIPRLIKEGAKELVVPLSVYFTKLLSKSTFSSRWKLANVCISDSSKPSSYRHIYMLSFFDKLMEGCVHKYLYNYVVSINLLTPKQSCSSWATPPLTK